MDLTYLLLTHPEPELAERLRRRFPTTFGGPRGVEEGARQTETENLDGSGTDIPVLQAA